MKNRNNELNKKLKLDNINWAEVILGLETTENFRERDIKRAFKKTGRSFNNNGPFHSTVREFIKALGEYVKTTRDNGENVYTITDKDKALEICGWRPKKQRTPVAVAVVVPKEEVKPEEPKKKDPIEVLKNQFKEEALGSRLTETIRLASIFAKNQKKVLESEVVSNSLIEMGVNYKGTYMKLGRPASQFILHELYDTELIIKRGKNSTWTLDGKVDSMDIYESLRKLYKTTIGSDAVDLDNYILEGPKVEEEVVEKKPEESKPDIKEIFKELKAIPKAPRDEDKEIRWKKWLILSAMLERRGAAQRINSISTWIRDSRNYQIHDEEISVLTREMQQDWAGRIKYHPGECVSLADEDKALCKYYDPRKLKEKFYVKLYLDPEEVLSIFPELKFTLEENLNKGYMYEVETDRSYNSEVALKKLLKVIQIHGKLYGHSWITDRVMKIVDKEEKAEVAKDLALRNIENL